MKKILMLLSCSFVSLHILSQDYLVRKSGDSIKVKVIEVGLQEIKYKEYSNLMGITYGIYKSEVLRIRYENGRIESFTEEELATSKSPMEKCLCGRSDAANYHGLKGGAFACGVWCGPFAILGTALSRQTPEMGVRTKRLSQHKVLFKDPDYVKCYSKQAKRDLINMEIQGMIVVVAVPIIFAFLLL